MPIKIDLNHLFGIDWEKIKLGDSKIKGLHHDLNGFFEKNGILEFRNKELIQRQDVTEQKFGKMEELIKKGITTFFPSHWGREKVVEKIIEAYGNITDKIIQNNGRFRIQGITHDNITIEMIIDKTGEIISAYPII